MGNRRKRERPFLAGDPSVDFYTRWGDYPPPPFTEKDLKDNETYRRMEREDIYKSSRLWPRSVPRYEDCCNFERANRRHWDQNLLDFARWVDRWREKRGIPVRPKSGPSDEFLKALSKVYPGPARPVPVDFSCY